MSFVPSPHIRSLRPIQYHPHCYTIFIYVTVTECEKKWRYLRDKFVKERRRLLEETKTTGRDAKSSWQHYESMQFLATHLRLPSNSSAGSESRSNGEGDSQRYSDGSPQPGDVMSPPAHHNADIPEIKHEQSWPPAPDVSEQFKTLFSPPQYPGFLANRPATAFTQHPLWAMWSNSLAQVQAQQQQQAAAAAAVAQQQLSDMAAANQQQTEIDNPVSPSVSEIAVCNDVSETSEPPVKKPKQQQEVNINVSIKDMMIPAERFSEYHFCVSLAEMMEHVPRQHRASLKIKLMQLVTSNSNPVSNQNGNMTTDYLTDAAPPAL